MAFSMKPLCLLLLVSVCLSRVSWAAPPSGTTPTNGIAPPSGVAVGGDVEKSESWTLARVQKLAPAQTITTTLKGQPYTATGIPLRALLEAASPKFPAQTKHPEARFIVLASGKDGYTVAFSWPDLMSDVGDQEVFLTWDANGKALPAEEGPMRLIVPGDKKPMRWVYSLVSVQVFDGARYHR